MVKRITNENKDIATNEKVSNEKKKYEKSDSKLIRMYEHFLGLLDSFGFKRVLQSFLFFFLIFIGNILITALNNEAIMSNISDAISHEHYENMDIRNEVSPQINNLLMSLVTYSQADRAFVMEMHNGKENPTKLAFVYCDMTYEEINPNSQLDYVYYEYENVNMSKYAFISYLHENRMFVGSVEELSKIDKKLAVRLSVNDIKYCGFITITSGVDIGFLGLSYLSDTPPVSKEFIQKKLMDYVQLISPKLDLKKQKELKELNLKK